MKTDWGILFLNTSEAYFPDGKDIMNMGMDQFSQEIFDVLERGSRNSKAAAVTTRNETIMSNGILITRPVASSAAASVPAAATVPEESNELKEMHDFIAAYGHLRR